jgi:hypothetical protein
MIGKRRKQSKLLNVPAIILVLGKFVSHFLQLFFQFLGHREEE